VAREPTRIAKTTPERQQIARPARDPTTSTRRSNGRGFLQSNLLGSTLGGVASRHYSITRRSKVDFSGAESGQVQHGSDAISFCEWQPVPVGCTNGPYEALSSRNLACARTMRVMEQPLSIALWCVLVAGLLPYVATLIAKSKRGFDNANPRVWLDGQQGFRQRANSAQLNSFEAFPLFAAAVIIATFLQAPQGGVDVLAAGFVIARLLYIACYVGNLAALRSVLWFAGLACCVALFVMAAKAA
jgi:uncharacterized MAPEG superfamily protein